MVFFLEEYTNFANFSKVWLEQQTNFPPEKIIINIHPFCLSFSLFYVV